MKFMSYVAAIVLIAGAAIAQTEALEKSCKSSKTAFEQRLADCTALINDQSFEKRAWAYERRGDAHEDNDDYGAAVADYDLALEIDPQHINALGGRVYALNQLDRQEEALPDILLKQQLQPDNHWNFYYHGLLLERLGRHEEALKALNIAVEMDGEYYYSRDERADVLYRLKRYDEAIADFQAARGLRPFVSWLYVRLSLAYFKIGDQENATKYYRMMQIINPNRDRVSRDIAELVKVAEQIDPPSGRYQKPRDGMKIRYLQSFLPIDTTSEMEQAIGALAAWFKAPPKAMPEALAFFTREFGHDKGDTLRVVPALEHGKNTEKLFPNGRLPALFETYRGMFRTGIRPDGEDGPNIKMVIDTGNPDDLWPLKVGNSVEGTGRLVFICPDEFQMQALMAGCKHGVTDVTLGQIEYGLLVEKVEQIFVPMGRFDTYVVRFRQLGRMEAFGRVVSRDMENRWWISPELGFWVKRTNQRGDKIAEIFAVEMVEE